MRLAALFSGGKDSTFAIYKIQKEGHQVECLVSIFPESEESLLLHYPNIEITKLQSESLRIPQIFMKTSSSKTEDELSALEELLRKAKDDYQIEGLVHGGILSEFQKKNFEKVCSNLNLNLVSPLWNKDQKEYMKGLIDADFHFIIASVSSDGLDEYWLGKEITSDELEKLEHLSKKYGFNLNFEGGEAETLVTNCPIFAYPIKITKAKKIWDGYRGRFEIEEAGLDYRAR
ncbi:MAG: diphthine--ammonia ligase [Nitrosopumilaceae archaeon]